MAKKVLIVGGGMTGTTLGLLLKQTFKTNLAASIWEKSDVLGGRMSTIKSQHCLADIGAQYISQTPMARQEHRIIYDQLISNKILVPFPGKIKGESRINPEGTLFYVAPMGMSSIVENIASDCGANLSLTQNLTRLHSSDDKKQVLVEATGNSGDSQQDAFDAVVLTMPIPQMYDVCTDMINACDFKQNLENVHYTCRYALTLFYEDGIQTPIPWNWSCKYFYENKCIRFISMDSKKRGSAFFAAVPSSIVIHTSVAFGVRYMNSNPEHVKSMILDSLVPIVPEGLIEESTDMAFHKWQYSQVRDPYIDHPGCVILSKDPCVLLAGDGFVETSNMDGCVESALKTRQILSGLVKA